MVKAKTSSLRSLCISLFLDRELITLSSIKCIWIFISAANEVLSQVGFTGFCYFCNLKSNLSSILVSVSIYWRCFGPQSFVLLIGNFQLQLYLKVLLREQVHQGRLSEDDSRRYFQQLIDAVAHCHSKGVYHRDLKVRNWTFWLQYSK